MKVNPSICGLEELRDATEQIDKKWRPDFLQEAKEAARLEKLLQRKLVQMMAPVYTSEEIIPKIQSRIDGEGDYDWTEDELAAKGVISEIREWCFSEVPFYIRKGARATLEDLEAFAKGSGTYSEFDAIQQIDFTSVDGRQIFADPDYGIEMEVVSRRDSNGLELPVSWSNTETHQLDAKPTSQGLDQLEDLIAEAQHYIEQLKEDSQELRLWIEQIDVRRDTGLKACNAICDSYIVRLRNQEQ